MKGSIKITSRAWAVLIIKYSLKLALNSGKIQCAQNITRGGLWIIIRDNILSFSSLRHARGNNPEKWHGIYLYHQINLWGVFPGNKRALRVQAGNQ
ncbi:hypothetical protein ACSPAB_07870 [Buttiauxella agrestis]